MKTLHLLLIGTAAFLLTAGAYAAPGAKPASGTPPTGAAKAKFSPGDTRIYIAIAEAMQFQLKASEKLRWKMKEGDAEVLALAAKINKEMTELYTPGVTMAQEHGVPGNLDKKPKSGTIPNDITVADRAALTKVDAMNKDEKKWLVALFELLAKESKKNAAVAEKAAQAAQDADLKAFTEKAAALLKSEAETVEAKFKELKTKK